MDFEDNVVRAKGDPIYVVRVRQGTVRNHHMRVGCDLVFASILFQPRAQIDAKGCRMCPDLAVGRSSGPCVQDVIDRLLKVPPVTVGFFGLALGAVGVLALFLLLVGEASRTRCFDWLGKAEFFECWGLAVEVLGIGLSDWLG